jgi:hypothetical protein
MNIVSFVLVSCIRSNILAGNNAFHRRKSLTPTITGTPLPIDGHFRRLLIAGSQGITYNKTKTPVVIEIMFPSGIVGRLYEVGIRSGNVYRIRVQLLEGSNGILYNVTSPQYNRTQYRSSSPILRGFPPVRVTGIRVFLLETIDARPARRVKIFTRGCFYKSSVKYTNMPSFESIESTTTQPKPKSMCKQQMSDDNGFILYTHIYIYIFTCSLI